VSGDAVNDRFGSSASHRDSPQHVGPSDEQVGAAAELIVLMATTCALASPDLPESAEFGSIVRMLP
jgi:hypothetical protein